MGIGFDQISENGPDPNRSDRPVEEEKQKKRKKSTKEMSKKRQKSLTNLRFYAEWDKVYRLTLFS